MFKHCIERADTILLFVIMIYGSMTYHWIIFGSGEILPSPWHHTTYFSLGEIDLHSSFSSILTPPSMDYNTAHTFLTILLSRATFFIIRTSSFALLLHFIIFYYFIIGLTHIQNVSPSLMRKGCDLKKNSKTKKSLIQFFDFSFFFMCDLALN